MSKQKYILVVVESPGKIKKIQDILGPQYLVAASYGHILDLKPKEMSVDLTTFEPSYAPQERQAKIIQDLKSKFKNASRVLLASDEDREGEMIAFSIAQVLNLKAENIHRIVFNSITKEAILNSIKNPRKLDYDLIDAQKARRILDRIVGYELSPILWSQLKQHDLSAGRVQSVVVKIIVEKENEIKQFFKEDALSYFKVKATFNINDIILTCNLMQNKKIANLNNDIAARSFINTAIQSKFTISDILEKKSISNPSPPFTTSTLQQEAFKKLGFNVQRTMLVAQKLYESGHITYMRTDSSNLSKEAITNIKDYIIKNYNINDYLQQVYASKKNNTQEAHEAIRPTHVETDYTGDASKDEFKLYNLIRKRSVASQMKPAEYKDVIIKITVSKTKEYYFEANVSKLVYAGYLKVYDIEDLEENKDEDDKEDKENKINKITNKITKIPDLNSQVDISKVLSLTSTQEYAKPPSRYNEGSLTKKLDPDNLNIGRPATTASIITKIQERGYVSIVDIPGIEKDALILELDVKKLKIKELSNKILLGKEANKFIPLSIGTVVNDVLQTQFPQIVDYKFTELVENDLDKIAEGKVKYTEVLKKFYKQFHELILKFKNSKNIIETKYTRIVGKYLNSTCSIIATLGKYGPMIKLEDLNDKKNKLCKEKTPAPIKEPMTIENITLEQCLELFKFPINLGEYKDSDVLLKTGKFGYYLNYNNSNIAIKDEIKDIDKYSLKDAIKVIALSQSNILKEFKDDKKRYVILEGPHGKYINISELGKSKIKKKKMNVGLPIDVNIEKLTLELVLDAITKYYEKKKTRFVKKTGDKVKVKDKVKDKVKVKK
jgi:DNA topoisomerase-1